jgi:hypothetical protein
VAHTATYAIALLGMGLLLLALTGLYLREAPALGRPGLAGYLTAFLGTLLVAGDWWFEAFVVPALAAQAPQILTEPPGASVLAGAVATVLFCTAGWIMFGIAALRAAVYPDRPPSCWSSPGRPECSPVDAVADPPRGRGRLDWRIATSIRGAHRHVCGPPGAQPTSSQDNTIREGPVPSDEARPARRPRRAGCCGIQVLDVRMDPLPPTAALSMNRGGRSAA